MASHLKLVFVLLVASAIQMTFAFPEVDEDEVLKGYKAHENEIAARLAMDPNSTFIHESHEEIQDESGNETMDVTFKTIIESGKTIGKSTQLATKDFSKIHLHITHYSYNPNGTVAEEINTHSFSEDGKETHEVTRMFFDQNGQEIPPPEGVDSADDGHAANVANAKAALLG